MLFKSTPRTEKIQEGMGAIPHKNGVAFRVWAPHADSVSVTGNFNAWAVDANPMKNDNGYWYADIPKAKAGSEYKFHIKSQWGEFDRIDPYARQVSSSVGHGIVYDSKAFDWGSDDFQANNWNELVIYELHVGTFNDKTPDSNKPANFDSIVERFDHLKRIGINAIQVMPVAEFAGDYSWGYNPADIFAVESAYGGPDGFKNFVKKAHEAGFAVILDVVYNHFGPSDLDLWRFDGWSEGDGGGIYFYQDWRKDTPWGATRPDYGRGEVRQFIRDNAMMWIEDFHLDGLRMDMTLYIRSVRADAEPNLPEGWSLLQWINGEIRQKYPNKLIIAEDLQHNEWLTKSPDEGGAGFTAQWCSKFVHPIREAAIAIEDSQRSMESIREAIEFKYNNDACQRIVYSESHDEVANGKARVPQEINPDGANDYYAQKKSTLAIALVFTTPGIPMLFQGQEFLEGGWFRDTVPVEWDRNEQFRGIVRLYRDLIRLRLNTKGLSRGLCGQHIKVTHIQEEMKMIAFHRWEMGGAGDDVMVVANFGNTPRGDYRIGFPYSGKWKLLLNTDWKGYSEAFTGEISLDARAVEGAYDCFGSNASFNVGPYSVLIFGREPG